MRGVSWLLVPTLLLCAACEKTVYVKRIEPPGTKPIPVEVPDNEKAKLGWYPAVKIGPDGAMHIAYCDVTRGDVRYGVRSAGGVLKLEVAAEEGAVGKYVALAVDKANQPHILYHDQDNKYLMYTARGEGGWQHEKIAWGAEIGMGARLIEHDGKLYGLFYDSREQLRLAVRDLPATKAFGSDEPWQEEVLDKAGGGWSVWIDLTVVGDKLVASYMHWNFVSSELRLGERPLSGGEWKTRVLYPLRKATPGWMSSLITGEPAGLSIAFTTMKAERIFYGPVPAAGDMRDSPVVGHYLNGMRAQRAANGDLVMAVAETGKGRLGNATLAVIRRRGDTWTRYTVDARRPVASQFDLAVGPKGEAIILYYADIDRGLYLYDETATPTRVEGARPSPEVTETGAAVEPAGAGTQAAAGSQPAASQPGTAQPGAAQPGAASQPGPASKPGASAQPATP